MQKQTKKTDTPINLSSVKRRRRAAFGLKAFVHFALLVVVAATTLVLVSGVLDDIADTERELAATQSQITTAQVRRREIEDTTAYTQSLSFVEYIARTRLNLVRRDEIIFIMTPE